MKARAAQQKDILFLFISTFIIVVAWIGFNLYHKMVTSTITPDLQMQIVPIDPRFDTVTIERLKKRISVTPIDTLSGTASPSAPSVTVSPSPSSSPTP